MGEVVTKKLSPVKSLINECLKHAENIIREEAMIQLSNTWDEVNQMYDITFCIKYANNFTH